MKGEHGGGNLRLGRERCSLSSTVCAVRDTVRKGVGHHGYDNVCVCVFSLEGRGSGVSDAARPLDRWGAGGGGPREKEHLDSAPTICRLALWASVPWVDRCLQRRPVNEPPSAG